MAYVYGTQGAPEEQSASAGTVSTLTNVAGAAISLALIVGIGVWGYKLIVRDVSGIPVVRAAIGEMRVRPEEPGGAPAQHQGLAVNTVAAHGAAEDPADRLILAPAPLDLTEEDQPMTTALSTQETTAPVEEVADGVDQAAIEALVAELTEGTDPIQIVATPEAVVTNAVVTTTSTDPIPEVTQAVVNAPGVKRSLRPIQRPAGRPSQIVNAVATAASPELDVAADSLAKGTRLAQLGAYDSPEVAHAAWDDLNQKFGDILAGKQRVVQKASSGGRTFYRLRAHGFADLSEARRFCSAFVSENADCITVTVK